ncbi:MAG: flagellar biosynthetic protein FliQ [Candidatus Gastranaerophilales bacterium]|nr:flagellar biosynthetic protein FliQ [Candidatus Gastranaerophilales bacterium]
MEVLLEHLGRGFINMLLIAMPCVLIAAGVGLVIGILQAVTSVQEQTIVAAPKILGVFLVIMLLGGFFAKIMTDYLKESANLAFNVITKEEDYVLDSQGYAGLNLDTKNNYMEGRQSDTDKLMKRPGKPPYSEYQQKPVFQKTNSEANSRPNLVETKKIINGN